MHALKTLLSCYKKTVLVNANDGSTRSAGLNKLKIRFKSKIRENSFSYPSVQVWNLAPADVTTASTESQARAAIRKFVKTRHIRAFKSTLPIYLSVVNLTGKACSLLND